MIRWQDGRRRPTGIQALAYWVAGTALMWLAAGLWIGSFEAHSVNPGMSDAVGCGAVVLQVAGALLWRRA